MRCSRRLAGNRGALIDARAALPVPVPVLRCPDAAQRWLCAGVGRGTDLPQMSDDEKIRTVVRRLSRRHPSGGEVIERAAIIAEADAVAIIAWITAHDGQPEAPAPAGSRHGLHGGRLNGSRDTASSTPRRYVLPRGVL